MDTNLTNNQSSPREHSRRNPGRFRSVITAGVTGFVALSIALAAPASAHTHHHSDTTGHHNPTTSTSAQHNRGAKSTRPTPTATTAPLSKAAATVATPAASSAPSAAIGPGAHDKCKRAKNGGMPLWCTDPAAGWDKSTLHRTEGNFPTLLSAQSNAREGRAVANQGAHR